MKRTLALTMAVIALGFAAQCEDNPKWISLFNGKDLTGWTAHGKAKWSVEKGVLVGIGGMGHLYSDAAVSDLEVKGMFRVSAEPGSTSNSGLYFRANPPANDPDGFPLGYEAQICHNQQAGTGWLWKPGKPTGPATDMLTRDGEWFSYRVKAIGSHIQFWINEKLVMTYDDDDFKQGHFVIQGHNPGMKIEVKDLSYRDLAKK